MDLNLAQAGAGGSDVRRGTGKCDWDWDKGAGPTRHTEAKGISKTWIEEDICLQSRLGGDRIIGTCR